LRSRRIRVGGRCVSAFGRDSRGPRSSRVARNSPNGPRPKFYTPAGGESFDELCARVRLALEALTETASDGDTLLVATHAGPLHALLRVALGESEASALGVRFLPATSTRFAFGPGGARVTQLNHQITDNVA
jgi:broad specificity phosphatase PhoE